MLFRGTAEAIIVLRLQASVSIGEVIVESEVLTDILISDLSISRWGECSIRRTLEYSNIRYLND